MDVRDNTMMVMRSCVCGASKVEVTHTGDVVCDDTIMVKSCIVEP